MIRRLTKAIFIKTKNYLTYMTDVDKILISKKKLYGEKLI